MGVATAATAAVAVGAGASYLGAERQARAAGAAAQSQRDSANDWMNYVQQSKQEALDSYDRYSASQQAVIDKSLQQQQQNVIRQQKLVDSIDPALIESGKQLQQLIQGQSAPVLQNVKDQRQVQRQNLIDSLRQQLGPGAETSSIGMNQLQKFDMETSGLVNQTQQDYISKLSNLSLQGAQTLGASLGSEISRQNSIGEQYGQIGRDRASIINQATSQSAGPMSAIMQTAGADQVGEQLRGAGMQALGQNIVQLGAAGLSYAGGKPTAAPGTVGDSVQQPQSVAWAGNDQPRQSAFGKGAGVYG